MNLNQIHNVYFIGIGGIGMSALARYFKTIGKNVSGYDKTETQLTRELQQHGIAIHFEDNIEFIDKDAQVIVYTPAVPKDHKEWFDSFHALNKEEYDKVIHPEMNSTGMIKMAEVIMHLLDSSAVQLDALSARTRAHSRKAPRWR